MSDITIRSSLLFPHLALSKLVYHLAVGDMNQWFAMVNYVFNQHKEWDITHFSMEMVKYEEGIMDELQISKTSLLKYAETDDTPYHNYLYEFDRTMKAFVYDYRLDEQFGGCLDTSYEYTLTKNDVDLILGEDGEFFEDERLVLRTLISEKLYRKPLL